MKYLGVDFGLRKIGLASGDDGTNLAFALGNIDGGADAVKNIIDRAKEEGTDAFVVGLPIPSAHQTEDQLERTKGFARDLQLISGMKVYVVDEQFSSAEARRMIVETQDAGRKTQVPEDALAAAIILQAFLDGDRELTIENAMKRSE